MVHFHELRVTPDGKHLIIDVHVIEHENYENVYIDKIYVDTDKTYMNVGPSGNFLFKEELDEYDNRKSIRLVYDIDGFGKRMFFVYVCTKGEPAADTPCGLKQKMTMAATYDTSVIYDTVTGSLGSFNDCQLPTGFITDYLKQKAFQLNLKGGNYSKAIEYWDSYVNGRIHKIRNFKCGCRG